MPQSEDPAAEATGQLILLSREFSYFPFTFFVEVGLFNGNPVPRGTRSRPRKAREQLPHFG